MKETVYPDRFAKRRAERQRKIRKRRIITFFVSLIILLLVVGITLSLTVFFPITKINVSGSKIYSAQEIIDVLPISTGDNILSFSAEKLEMVSRNRLPYIKDINVKRSLDGNLDLKVTDAKEKTVYETTDGYYVVGDDGFTLNLYKKRPKKLLLIKGMDAEISVGNFISFTDEGKTEILNELLLNTEKSNITAIDITDEYSLTVYVDNRLEVYLGTSNNIKEKLSHLNSMVETIGEGKEGKINLSYWSQQKPEGTFVEKKGK